MPQPGQLVQLVAQELLVAFGARHRHLDQIVILAGQQVRLHDLGQLRQCAAEAVEHVVVVPLQRDLDQHGVGQAQRLLVQQRGIALDHAGLLERTDAVPAWRRR